MDEHTLKIIDCFENFLVYCQAEKGLLNSTIVNYKNDFKTFYKFISKEFVSELNEDDLINFLYYQMDNGNKANTIIRRISTIESFFTFLKEEYSLNNFSNCKLERPKVGKKLPEYLNNEEINRLFNFLNNSKNYSTYKLIFEMFYYCGLRLSELTNLKKSDIKVSQKLISVNGKGKKIRHIPITDDFLNELIAYNSTNHNSLYFFSDNNGNKLKNNSVYNNIRKIGIEANVNKNLHPHMLRHSFATHLINNNVSFMAIKDLLGHEDIKTTQIYVHLNTAKKVQSYDLYREDK